VHELTIATSLVEALLEIAKQQSSNKIVAVHLKVGKLRLISVEQLRFSYEILSKGTLLEGSQLTIEETPGFTRCPNCGYAQELQTGDLTYHFALPVMKCPKCGSDLKIEGGDECLITKVRMTLPETAEPTVSTGPRTAESPER